MTRKYSSISIETTLASSITNTQTTMTVVTGAGSALMGGVTLAPGNVDQFTVAIDPDTPNEEIVFITGVSADTMTIVRGRAGSSAISHYSGATVRHVLTSDDLTYFNTTLPATLIEAKGDLIVGTGANAADNLAVGADNTVLMADSTQLMGVKWGTVSGGGTDISFNAQTGTSYTLALSDKDKLVTLNNSSAITLTIPTNASVAFPTGAQVNIQQLGTGQVTVVGASGVTFTGNGTKLRAQYSAATLIKTGTNTWTLIGDIS